MLFAVLALVVAGCAKEEPKKDGKEGMMTAQQKECVKKFNCPRDKKDEAARACKKKAFEACGVNKKDWAGKKEHKAEHGGRSKARDMARTQK